MEARGAGEALVFEDWHFDRQAHRLFRQAATGAWIPVSIGSRALDILALLLERPGTLVSKEAIMDAVWPNAAVEANNLTVQVSALRHVLDQHRTAGSCIQTVPGRGYRFVVPVLLHEQAPRLPQAPPPQAPPTDSDLGDAAPGELGMSMVDIESARGMRERPSNPDAFDLILRARSLQDRPPSAQQYNQTEALYERALALDPSSVPALIGIGFILVNRAAVDNWGAAENMRRAEQLLMRARAIAPDSEGVLNLTAQWFRSLARYQKSQAVAEELIQQFPNNEAGYFDLAQIKAATGHADEVVPLEEQAIRLNPRSPWMYARYRDMGFASLLLGKDQDAISFLQQSLAANLDDNGDRQWLYRCLAAAYARTGQMPEAKHALAEADLLWPYDTVRTPWPLDRSSTVAAGQIKRLQDGLRLAGERDHADEDTDFGVPADARLHNDFAGLTPTYAPGTRTIRTADLAQFLAQARPVVIDTVSYLWGRSIPGAVGLQNAGLGGAFSDTAQDHLRRKMQELTSGDLSKPIVAVGWNSERFDGRNLALRLVALGYTHVYWYRGGREAWEVANLPEADLALQEW